MGCTDPPLEGGSAHPISVLSGFGSKLPLPLYADVRLHIPMTHTHGRPIGWETYQPVTQLWLYKYYGDLQTMKDSFNQTRAYIELLDSNPPGIDSGTEGTKRPVLLSEKLKDTAGMLPPLPPSCEQGCTLNSLFSLAGSNLRTRQSC